MTFWKNSQFYLHVFVYLFLFPVDRLEQILFWSCHQWRVPNLRSGLIFWQIFIWSSSGQFTVLTNQFYCPYAWPSWWSVPVIADQGYCVGGQWALSGCVVFRPKVTVNNACHCSLWSATSYSLIFWLLAGVDVTVTLHLRSNCKLNLKVNDL